VDGGPARVPGRYWRIPAGETHWDLDATRQWGAGVEHDVVRKVGVVPKPVQKPHPPIFQPFASSERSIRWCAEESVTAILPQLHPKTERHLFELYAEVSGRPLGDGIGVLRDVVIADSDDEAMALWHDSGAFAGAAWFAPFGFAKGLVDPDTGETPADPLAEGLALIGTVDTVTRQLEVLLRRLPAQWIFAWTYNGLIPHAKLMHSIERFATEVMPRVAAAG
jgi:alkanesulfonate monooxygenase SsuD/methylene tetrahydromethanopterin reductase-like flavin-dependent oxidoreductase (luciferase family)